MRFPGCDVNVVDGLESCLMAGANEGTVKQAPLVRTKSSLQYPYVLTRTSFFTLVWSGVVCSSLCCTENGDGGMFIVSMLGHHVLKSCLVRYRV